MKTKITTIGKNLFQFFYNKIGSKFNNILNTLQKYFPILKKHPSLKFGLIPAVIGGLFTIRYFIKTLINEFVSIASTNMGEIAGYNITKNMILHLVIGSLFTFRLFAFIIKRKRETDIKQMEIVPTKS